MNDSAINHRPAARCSTGRPWTAAIDEARAELAALLRAPGGGEPSRLTEARALLGSPARPAGGPGGGAAGRPGRPRGRGRPGRPQRGHRGDRRAAVLAPGRRRGLAGGGADPRPAQLRPVHRPLAGRRAPDPDDLDAACDLLLRGARYDDADERTTLYLFLALRDRQHLLACPSDAKALMTWGRRLLTFPDAGGLGRSGLHDMLELELLNREVSRAAGGAPGASGPPVYDRLRLTRLPSWPPRPRLGRSGGRPGRIPPRQPAIRRLTPAADRPQGWLCQRVRT